MWEWVDQVRQGWCEGAWEGEGQVCEWWVMRGLGREWERGEGELPH